jgi:hypothetical protein
MHAFTEINDLAPTDRDAFLTTTPALAPTSTYRASPTTPVSVPALPSSLTVTNCPPRHPPQRPPTFIPTLDAAPPPDAQSAVPAPDSRCTLIDPTLRDDPAATSVSLDTTICRAIKPRSPVEANAAEIFDEDTDREEFAYFDEDTAAAIRGAAAIHGDAATFAGEREDVLKLDRIYGIKGRNIVLRTRGICLISYANMSYAIQTLSKRRTGIYVTLGGDPAADMFTGDPIWSRSYVQRLIATSCFEAEIIALYNLRDFNYDCRGERYIVRFTYTNERIRPCSQLVEAGVAKLVHVRTELQIADGLTKPFYSKSQLHILFRTLNDFGTLFGEVYDSSARAAPDTNF